LGAISAVSRAGERGEFFLSGKQRTTLPIFRRPNFTKFEQNTSIGEAMNSIEQNFENCPVKGPFPKKREIDFFQRLATSDRHKSAMIIDRRQFITK